ncbi:MAG: hypothetical protein WDM78_11045 [Puia sp.]
MMDNAREVLNGQPAFQYQNLNGAANYALAHNIDTALAMQWINRSIAAKPDNYTGYVSKSGTVEKSR